MDRLPIVLFFCALVLVSLALQKPPAHSLLIQFPTSFADPVSVPPEPPTHRIAIGADGLVTIDGVRVTDARLPMMPVKLKREQAEPRIQFDPHALLPYGRVLEVLAFVEKAVLADGSFCFAALARYRTFDRDWKTRPMFLTLAEPPPPDEPFNRVDPPPCELSPAA